MANKYLIEGATYCGDGTASNEAASAGATGAWNNINVFEGTAPAYGTAPAAGDTVYIRSKTSAGADISRTHAANISLGSTAATDASPITWILDNGTVWSGIDGTLTYTTNGAYSKTVVASNVIECRTKNALILESTATNPAAHSYLVVNGVLRRAAFDNSARTSISNACVIAIVGAVEDCFFKLGRFGTGTTSAAFYTFISSTHALVNCDIELTNSTVTAGQSLFGFSGSAMSRYLVIGGRIFGAGAISGTCLMTFAANPGSSFHSIGFEIPKALTLCAVYPTLRQRVEIIGCDDGLGGFFSEVWGWATSRTDNNPPTLSTLFEDSGATPWAWRVFPSGAGVSTPVILPTVRYYSDTASTRTITQELLVSDTLTFTKDGAWIDVEYTDNSTGLKTYVSSKVSGDATELDTSTANWTTTAWGTVTLDKRKISVTTPTAIKPDTQVTVTFMTRHKGTNTDDIFFLDPGVSIA